MPNSPSRLARQRFASEDRLRRATGYGHVIGGKSVGNQYVKIFFACNGSENSRLGIISSKKVFPLATQRNLSKRIVREVYRKHEIKRLGVDLVVMPKSAAWVTRLDNELNLFFGLIRNKCADS